jgi:hypothetical protein
MKSRRRTVLGVCLIVLATGVTSIDAAEAKRKLGRYYGGVTSQGAPFVLELAKGGKAVSGASILVNGECDDGNGMSYHGRLSFEPGMPAFVPLGEHVFGSRRVSKSGRFRASGIGAEQFGDADGLMSETFSGRIRRNGAAAGKYRSIVTMVAPDGSTVTRCDTGTVKWSATSDRGRIYAGTSSAGFPVVLELAARRTSVKRMRFGWGALCTPEGSVIIPDELTGFRLSGGSFGDAFQQSFDRDDGGKNLYDYDLDGKVSRSIASGTFSVKLTETDPAGATTATCDAGTATWTARSG